MTLFINNDVAHELLTMDDTMEVMEQTYRDLVTTDVVCRPRMDMQIPPANTGSCSNGAPWRGAPSAAISPSA